MNDPHRNAVPISAEVRARVEAAGRRFHANDNIAEFIRDEAELKAHMTNSIMRGAFLTNPELRKEFLQLVRG
jgi:GTP cyclohydrolase I